MGIDLKTIQTPPARKEMTKTGTNARIKNFLNRDIKLFRHGMKDSKKERFYSELTILLSSGIDIKTSLDIIIEEQKKENDKKLFEKIRDKVLAGASLSDGLQQTGKFSNYEYFSLRIGEESGRMNEVLQELTRYYSIRIKQKRQLTSALSYPLLVLTIAVVAVIFMLNFIVPMFAGIFKRFGGELPALTKLVISASAFMKEHGSTIGLLMIILILILFQIRKKKWFRKYSSLILLRLPVIGSLVNKVYLARFCQSMALLTASKTPMLRSIELVRQMIGFFPFEEALEYIREDIMHGKMLYESMSKYKIFNKRTVFLTKVAEEVNQLGNIFTKLNGQFTEELEYQTGIIGNLMEPLLIIFVGLLVMAILISMYLPLFQLSTSIY